MIIFRDKYEDQTIDPVDTLYEVDQIKLIKWLKHMSKLNMFLMNDLSRDSVQRGVDKGRHETYSGLLQFIQHGQIITK